MAYGEISNGWYDVESMYIVYRSRSERFMAKNKVYLMSRCVLLFVHWFISMTGRWSAATGVLSCFWPDFYCHFLHPNVVFCEFCCVKCCQVLQKLRWNESSPRHGSWGKNPPNPSTPGMKICRRKEVVMRSWKIWSGSWGWSPRRPLVAAPAGPAIINPDPKFPSGYD